MDQFKITIDRQSNTISVHNNGRGIPIQMHEKENMYIPELIFGNLSVSLLSLRPLAQIPVQRLTGQLLSIWMSQPDILQLRRRREEADGRTKRFRSQAHKHLLAHVQSVQLSSRLSAGQFSLMRSFNPFPAVETADKDSGLKYVQTFSENMSKKTKPKVRAFRVHCTCSRATRSSLV